MRHRKKKVTLDRKKGPRTALLKNLTTQFFLYEKIKTTDAKARALRPIVERIISKGRVNTLATRRELMKCVTVSQVVTKILEDISPRYLNRQGGYTRLVKLGQRQGDGAQVTQIELVK